MIAQAPIIVRIVQPPKDPLGLKTLMDTVVGALGLTGALAIVALVAGVLMGALLFWFRSRSA